MGRGGGGLRPDQSAGGGDQLAGDEDCVGLACTGMAMTQDGDGIGKEDWRQCQLWQSLAVPG